MSYFAKTAKSVAAVASTIHTPLNEVKGLSVPGSSEAVMEAIRHIRKSREGTLQF